MCKVTEPFRKLACGLPSLYDMRVYVSEQKRGMTRAIKRDLGRRAAVEPVIGHLKTDHRMDRNFLIGSHGDAANAVLAAVGYNFRRLVAWLREFLCAWFLVLLRPGQASSERRHSSRCDPALLH